MIIIGNSEKILKVKELIKKVAITNAPVLILGESGTGKELVAREIHNLSDRKNENFVAINSSAIPYDLLESELFGYEKGAFTGAYGSRVGKFELADKGTIFLDEIGDMPLIMQAKLLRVLQDKTIERIGSNKIINTDARILAATNRNLEELIENNKFREDLFYRLNVFPINLPPLRQRIEDIPELIEYFTEEFFRQNKSRCYFSKEVLNALKTYNWPGNIRELNNVIQRLCILYPNKKVTLAELSTEILPLDFKTEEVANINYRKKINSLNFTENSDSNNVNFNSTKDSSSQDDDFMLKKLIQDIEIKYISKALEVSGYKISQAAKKLGLKRTTLIEKIKKYNL